MPEKERSGLAGHVSSLPQGRKWKFGRYTHTKKGYDMEPLPLSFRDRGFLYEQVERQGEVALYSQTNHSGIVRYEVIRIRIQREHTWPNGTTTPEKEAYPGSNSWGTLAWTFFSKSRCQSQTARPPGPARRGDRRPRPAGAGDAP